jgi:hypothetical protein
MFARRRSSPAADAAYRVSNAAVGLPVAPSAVARGLALRMLDVSDAAADRRRLGQMLLDELSAAAGLIHVELVVPDRAQVHEHDGRRLQSRTYGYYRCWFEGGEVARGRIRIYHRTAVRQQVITPKVFLNTLLHEWNHHFDFAGLRLPRSPHTSGFYARLRALADALDVGMVLPPERDAEGNPIAREARASSTRVLGRRAPAP